MVEVHKCHIFLWEHGEEKLKEFTEHLNEIDWSQTSTNFLNVTVSLIG